MTEIKPTIFIVDDDPSVRESTELMLKSVGFNVKAFSSAQDFLKANVEEYPGCLILDVRPLMAAATEWCLFVLNSGEVIWSAK